MPNKPTMPALVAIVAPCYNEEEALAYTSTTLSDLLQRLIAEGLASANSYALLVDDGSADKTWDIISALHTGSLLFRGLKLSRNFGHQNALLAGLLHAREADAVISIDADLQDDPEAIRPMLQKFADGYDVVYGVREQRKTDTWMKRNTALFFYGLLKRMGVRSVYNHADYRLMSRRVLDAFADFTEINLYIRGMIPLVGFRTATVLYNRSARVAGESKYNLRKMLAFAWDGITSLSVRPLHFVTIIGFSVFCFSILLTIFAFITYFFFNTRSGWASTVIPLYFLGGIQLLCTGLIGEYVGKIYREVKGRPRFIVEEMIGVEGNDRSAAGE